MKIFFIFIFLTLSFSLFASPSAEITFVAETNGPGVKIEGSVTNPKLKLDASSLQTAVVEMDAIDLITGLELRDNHLHKKVFGAIDKGTALIIFKMKSFDCDNKTFLCQAKGSLAINDVSNDLGFVVTKDPNGKIFSGKTTVSLNAFHLTAPSFMGIKPLDSVEVNFKLKLE